MNASPDTEYEFTLPEGSPSAAYDLISKTQISLSSNPIIQPQSTLILEWSEEINVYTGIEFIETPTSFKLGQNYPNPFNQSTTIEYSISSVATGYGKSILLEVYDILGNKVATLVNEKQTIGSNKVTFDASNLSSGVYFYQLKSGSTYQTRKMLLKR